MTMKAVQAKQVELLVWRARQANNHYRNSRRLVLGKKKRVYEPCTSV
jgi:hypothetical protein